MLKNILNLQGAQELNKNEQKLINGGGGGDDDCISAIGGGCRCDFPNHCILVNPSSSCPAGSIPQDPNCFK